MCKTLLPDVVVPEVHQNDRSYVCELSGPTFGSLLKIFSIMGCYTENLKINRSVKIGGWTLAQDNTVVR